MTFNYNYYELVNFKLPKSKFNFFLLEINIINKHNINFTIRDVC